MYTCGGFMIDQIQSIVKYTTKKGQDHFLSFV